MVATPAAAAAAEIAAIAETCRFYLDAYGAWVHGHRPARHHAVWLEKITALVEGRSAKRRLLIVAPPGHGKSTWLSLIFPAWYLGCHPDHSLLFFTSSDVNAVQFGRVVRSTLEANERHQATFPRPACRPDPDRGWSGDGLYLGGTPQGSKDPAYRSVGYGASIIGARAHGIVLDDPLTQQAAQSETEQAAAKHYHDMTVDSRLHPDGWELAIMTAWHELDLRAYLMARPSWDVVVQPALGAHEWGEGALWPERFSAAWLREKQQELGGPTFEALYQGDPTALGGDVFREAAWFKPLPPGFDLPDGVTGRTARSRLTLVQYYDLAFSGKASADYTAGVTVGRLPIPAGQPAAPGGTSENLYVTHAWREQIAEEGLAAAIAGQIIAQRPALVGIEEGAYRQAATQDLLRSVAPLLTAAGVAVPVIGVRVTTDKVFRARLPAARAEAGHLYVDKATAWAPTLIAECMGFPRGAHDDLCLAGETMVQAADGLRRLDAIQAGDVVLGQSGWVTVEAAGCTGTRPVVTNGPLCGTADHPVWTDRGWVPLARVDATMSVWIPSVLSLDVRVPPWRRGSAGCTTSDSTRDLPLGLPVPCASYRGQLVPWTTVASPSKAAVSAPSTTVDGSATAIHSRFWARSAALFALRHRSSTAPSSAATQTVASRRIAATSSQVGRILCAAFRHSTRKFGGTTTVPFPRVLTFTTRTTTRLITALRTWNCLAKWPTLRRMPTPAARTGSLRSSERTLSGSGRSHPRGTAHQQVARGTESTDASRLERVYNLKTSDGTYFANGVLVHNCDALAGACQLAIEHVRPHEGVRRSSYSVGAPAKPTPAQVAATHLRGPAGTPGGAVDPWADAARTRTAEAAFAAALAASLNAPAGAPNG